MKRHVALHALSEEHHLGLVAARHLRRAAVGDATLAADAARRFLAFWEAALVGHFRAEEEILLPHAARGLVPEDPRFARLSLEHLRVRRAVLALRAALAGASDARCLLAEIAEVLPDHIRWEERDLFPAVEAALSEDDLQAMAAALAAAGVVKGRVCHLAW